MRGNELKRGELVTVADGDGQQYVVLEVITLEDGTEQHVAVVAPDMLEEEPDGILLLNDYLIISRVIRSIIFNILIIRIR